MDEKEFKSKRWKLIKTDTTQCTGCDLIEHENCLELVNYLCKSDSHFIVKEVKDGTE